MDNRDNSASRRNDALEAEAYLRAPRLLWRFSLALPLVYLGAALLIRRYWMEDGRGFWPLRGWRYFAMLVAAYAAAASAQAYLLKIGRSFDARIIAAYSDAALLAELYWRRTLYQGVCADTVSFIGLIAFLFNADTNALGLFLICSYLLYAQIAPRQTRKEKSP